MRRLWLAGLIWFAAPPAGDWLAAPTDAIVVLTGGSLRLQSGIELLREGKGRMLFVSGVNRQVDLEDLLRISIDPVGLDRKLGGVLHRARASSRQYLGQCAGDRNRWMRSRGFRSLRLVTAWYHMPRSLLEFERAMPDVEIVAHPVFP